MRNKCCCTMYKKLFVLCLVVALCLAQDDDLEESGRKKRIRYKHKHHLYHSGILYYLAFLAVKVKIVFLIGAMVSFWLFAGKLFAILRYGSWDKEKKEEPPEKVYVHSDPHPSFYPSYSPSSDFYGPPDHGDQHFSRGFDYNVYDAVDIFKNAIERFNLNEYAFESMNLEGDSCRKKFVCEADYKARNNSLLRLGMLVFGDANLRKYKTEVPVESFEDCHKIYSDCTTILEKNN